MVLPSPRVGLEARLVGHITALTLSFLLCQVWVWNAVPEAQPSSKPWLCVSPSGASREPEGCANGTGNLRLAPGSRLAAAAQLSQAMAASLTSARSLLER